MKIIFALVLSLIIAGCTSTSSRDTESLNCLQKTKSILINNTKFDFSVEIKNLNLCAGEKFLINEKYTPTQNFIHDNTTLLSSPVYRELYYKNEKNEIFDISYNIPFFNHEQIQFPEKYIQKYSNLPHPQHLTFYLPGTYYLRYKFNEMNVGDWWFEFKVRAPSPDYNTNIPIKECMDYDNTEFTLFTAEP